MPKLITVALAEDQTQDWIDGTVARIRDMLGSETKVVIVGQCNQITVTDYDPAAGG